MQEIIEYYNNTLEKDENKVYYLFKRVSTKDTLFYIINQEKKQKTK